MGGVDQWHCAVTGIDQNAELRAAQDDGLRTPINEIGDSQPECVTRLGNEPSSGKLLVEGVVDDLGMVIFGHDDVKSVAVTEPTGEVGAGHRVLAAQQPDPGETLG